MVVEPDKIKQLLHTQGYLINSQLLYSINLAMSLNLPLLIEGAPGSGKTSLALALAQALNCDFFRLQCYEGLDITKACYEWNYPQQLLWLRQQEVEKNKSIKTNLYDEKFLIERALLKTLRSESKKPILLIDEIDRSDFQFEAFLLEFLAERQITIPELGCIKAKNQPLVILTSNNTREISDAMRRRCIYHYIELPNFVEELAIIKLKVPQATEQLTHQVVEMVQEIRKMNLSQTPSIAESIDWIEGLLNMGWKDLTKLPIDQLKASMNCLIKTQTDAEQFDNTTLKNLVG